MSWTGTQKTSSALVDTSSSPHVRLRPVGLTEVRWGKDGLLADRVRACREVMVPSMGKLLMEQERFRYVGNFKVAAGKEEGRHRGAKWNDGDFYKWVESACAILASGRDAALEKQIDEITQMIADSQRADGYIHSPVVIGNRTGTGDQTPFANPMHFEMYNMGHLLTAGIVHFRITGKRNLLNLGIKAIDFLDREFANPTPAVARHGICPAHLMSIVDLYRLTKEKRYLDLAVRLLNMRDLVEKGDDDNQDRVKLRDQREAVGHAVRGTYLYASATDIYAETGDESLKVALEAIWNDLVTKKLYITGGCGALFDGASPDGSEDQANITRVHQAFGRSYQFPQSTAHNETCAAIGNLMWNWRMFLLTGDGKYADLVEGTFYNSVLAGISLDGTAFFYTNTLRQLDKMPVPLRWNLHRKKYISCFCCPPNVVRTIAEIGGYAYALDKDECRVVLYGDNTLDTVLPSGERLALTQKSRYPWDGKVRITIDHAPASAISIALRVPGWCAATALLNVNGVAIPMLPENGFTSLRRSWKPGDVIEFDLPMPAMVVEGHPLIEDTRNQVAVAHGPIIYCLESADLPKGTKVLDVSLPREASFTLDENRSDLAGATALQTRGAVRHSETWEQQLYRYAANVKPGSIDLTLVPYYAWDNRDEGEMTVWIPST